MDRGRHETDRRGDDLGQSRRASRLDGDALGGRRRFSHTLLVLTCALVSLVVSLPFSPSRAQSSVHGEVFVILASDVPGVIAPELAGIAALRQPPFSSFGSMTLLGSHPVDLAVGSPVDIPLPNGRVLQVLAEARTADGRYPTRVSINRPGESDYLPVLSVLAAPCDPFFVAGQSFGGGTLVIGVRLGDRCR